MKIFEVLFNPHDASWMGEHRFLFKTECWDDLLKDGGEFWEFIDDHLCVAYIYEVGKKSKLEDEELDQGEEDDAINALATRRTVRLVKQMLREGHCAIGLDPDPASLTYDLCGIRILVHEPSPDIVEWLDKSGLLGFSTKR